MLLGRNKDQDKSITEPYNPEKDLNIQEQQTEIYPVDLEAKASLPDNREGQILTAFLMQENSKETLERAQEILTKIMNINHELFGHPIAESQEYAATTEGRIVNVHLNLEAVNKTLSEISRYIAPLASFASPS